MVCSIPDCGKPSKGLGYCQAHYTRLRRHGDPLGGRTSVGEPLRFYEEVVLHCAGDACLTWPYSTVKGYGAMTVAGRTAHVHRLVCEAVHGTPPSPKHEAAHNCGNQICVNPNHLEWKTPAANNADKLIHGTHNRGERHNLVKLTEGQAREALVLRGIESQRSLASRLGVSRRTVADIQMGRTWAWLV